MTLAGTPYTIYGAGFWKDENTLEVWVRPIESIGIRYLTFRFNGRKVRLETISDPTLGEVLDDLRFTIDDMFRTKVGKNFGGKVFDSIQRIVEPVLHGELLERVVPNVDADGRAEQAPEVEEPDDGVAQTAEA